MVKKGIVKKLLLKADQKTLLINVPEKIMNTFNLLNQTNQDGSLYDAGLIFVENKTELHNIMREIVRKIKHDGIFWVCYKKGGLKAETDLNRDTLWNEMHRYRQVGVSLIAIDFIWSAMRFRPDDVME